MGKRVFDARSAPQDEIAGVRSALSASDIDFYETKTGNWGFGGAALWVRNPADHGRARQIIDQFQASWRERARREAMPPRINWAGVPPLLLALAVVAWITYELVTW